MKSKASSQTTDAVVAEWQTACETHGFAILSQGAHRFGHHLDGAVKQRCVHRTITLQELDDLLSAYDMKRDLVELNYKAAQWAHRAVWNPYAMLGVLRGGTRSRVV